MKTRTLASFGVAGMLITVASPAMAGAVGGTGFAGSGHDETNYASGTVPGTIATGACVSCHTPHQAKSTNLLWNHTLSASNFSWSGATSTTAGTTYATFNGQTYSGMSAKCLSCHDGTVATNSGQWFLGTLQPLNGEFVGQGFLTNPWSVIGGYNLGATTNNRPAAGTGTNGAGHMEGTHPLAMPYPYLQAQNKYNNVTTGANYIPSEWVGDPTANGIRLYTDNAGDGSDIVAGVTPGKTGMECGSCHDVHNGTRVVATPATSGVAGAFAPNYYVTGLMTGDTSSYICFKCHNK